MSKNESKYVQTDIGMIPADWEVKKLATLVEKVGSGVTPKGGEKVYQRQGRPFVRSQNVGWGKFLLHDLYYLPEDIHTKMLSTELKRNDVLLNITGASIGRTAVVDESVEGGNVNQHVCIIRGKKNAIDSYFLNQVLISKIGQTQIDSFQAGGNRQGLNFEQIRSFYIPLPSLPEQRKIATILQTWDKAIAQTQKLIDAKEKLKRGLKQKLLTGQVRFSKYKKEKWEKNVLSEVVELFHGYQFRNFDFTPSGIPIIKIGNVNGYKLDLSEITYISEQRLNEFKEYIISNGDLLMSLTGNIGRVVEVNGMTEPVLQNYRVGKFFPRNKKLSKNYLKHLLSSEILFNQFAGMANQSAQANFGKQDMDKLHITFPTNIKEQERIADALTLFESELMNLNIRMILFKKQKEGLMQQLLTGKKRVKIK